MIYLIINLFTIIPTLALSFSKQLKGKFSHLSALLAILSVGIVFIFWDHIALKQGHWSFSNEYTLGIGLFGLPFEEILFFVTVPFASIFVYEVLDFYRVRSLVKVVPFVLFGYFSLGLFITVLASSQGFPEYATFVGILLIGYVAYQIFIRRNYPEKFVAYNVYALLSFFIVNSLLTGIPIVLYGEGITGLRVGTIPIEDFAYNYLLLNIVLETYQIFKKKR